MSQSSSPGSTELAHQAFEHVKHGIVVYDLDLTVRQINERVRELLHVSAQQFAVGEPFENLVRCNAENGGYGGYGGDGAVEERIARRMAKARSFEAFRQDQQLFDGRYVEVYGQPIPGLGYVLTYTDITARITAERSAKDNEARFRDYASASSDWLWQVDTEFCFTDVSSRFAEVTGKPPSHLIGRTSNVLTGEHLDEVQRAAMVAAIAQRQPFRDVSYTGETGSGEPRHYSVSGVPFFAEDGTLLGYRGTGSDITVHKQVEMQLRQATLDAQSANVAKSAFLANMSHEIRTPMNGVVGMADVLSQAGLPEEQWRMVQVIRKSSKSLLRIIDDILDLSKIEAGKLSLEAVPVRLWDLVEELVDSMRVISDEHDVRLRLELDLRLPRFIIADPVRLRQVLMNLLSNAVKFSGRRQDGRQGLVKLMVVRDGPEAMTFTVKDNGIGMAAATVARLFQPFNQAEDSTTRRFGGTGLGLVITHNLVHMMNGTIVADSRLGEGSSLRVKLPVAEIEGPDDDPDISGLRVLALVDDDLNQANIAAHIQRGGASVRFADHERALTAEVAASGQEAIVMLGLPTSAQNDRVRDLVSQHSSDVRFVVLAAHRSDASNCQLPDSYAVQRFPVLPSELIRGIAILAGRTSPTSDHAVLRAPAGQLATAAHGDTGTRILLVEDNEINQEVIALQLRMLGHQVEVASNGIEGVDKWDAGCFDLVLSDCHMPLMDGFQMTAEMRRRERHRGAHRTPIVAITANAMRGEAARCVEAGMDAYLSKPVETSRLRQMLGRWLPSGAGLKGREQTLFADRAQNQTALAVLDPHALTAAVGDMPDRHREMLDKFAHTSVEIVADLYRAFEDGAADAVGELGHKLKSSSKTVGAHALAELCAVLEAAGVANDWETIEHHAPRLQEVFDTTCACIADRFCGD